MFEADRFIARPTRCIVAHNQYAPSTETVGCGHVTGGVTYYRRSTEVDFRVVPLRLDEEPNIWLAAIARPVLMGAVIDPVQSGPSRSEPVTQRGVYVLEIAGAEAAKRDPSLVRHYHHQHALFVQQPYSLHRAVEQVEFIWCLDVVALYRSPVQNPIAVQEYSCGAHSLPAACRFEERNVGTARSKTK